MAIFLSKLPLMPYMAVRELIKNFLRNSRQSRILLEFLFVIKWNESGNCLNGYRNIVKRNEQFFSLHFFSSKQ